MAENGQTSQRDAGPKASRSTRRSNAISWIDLDAFCRRPPKRSSVYLPSALAIVAALFSSTGSKTPEQWRCVVKARVRRAIKQPILRAKHAKDGHATLVVLANGWAIRQAISTYCKKYPVTLSPALVTIHRASLPVPTITRSTSNVCPSEVATSVPVPVQSVATVAVPVAVTM